MPTEREDAEWRDPGNWRARVFYVAPDDPRVWVPKRMPGFGWTLNFAHRAAWVWLAALIGIPVGVALLAGLAGARHGR